MRCICGLPGFWGLDCCGFRWFVRGWFSRLLLGQIGRSVLVLVWCLCCLCLLFWAIAITVLFCGCWVLWWCLELWLLRGLCLAF